jgi:hypothetical protein
MELKGYLMESQASVQSSFMARRMSFTDQIRQAIAHSEVTRYRIAQETGVAESTLSRFMGGKGGLSLDALERVGEYLDLMVVVAPQRGDGRKGR